MEFDVWGWRERREVETMQEVDATSGLVYIGIPGEGGDWEVHIPDKSREKSDVV